MKRLSLSILERAIQFETWLGTYIDGNNNRSIMKWIPPFRACRAITPVAAAATPSNTIGDWFHPEDIQSGWVLNTDYEVYSMGGYWVDMYLCSSSDATSGNMGTVGSGTTAAYISQPFVSPRVAQNIAHFKQYLGQRFDFGGFVSSAGSVWAGKGGLITDQHWFELWIWTRINRWLLRGNTAGYNNSLPQWDKDANEIGRLDTAQGPTYGGGITGGGPKFWEVPISDFSGNRWEFTDGLRLFDGGIYSAGKKVNPGTPYTHVDYTNTGLSISAVTSGQSILSYRSEAALKLHGIPSSTITAGQDGFDGGGLWYTAAGEMIALRGGSCGTGVQAPGALNMSNSPSSASWVIGARAVLVP